LSDLSVLAAGREAPGRVALVDAAGELTFGELAGLAQAAVKGLPREQRVLIAPRPCRQDIATLLGMLEHRISFALANPLWSEAELRDAAERTGASTLILDGERTTTHAAAVAAEQTLVFTSGSSGQAKIVRLSHQALVAAATAHAMALPWTPDDAWVLTLPVAHIGGLSVLTRALFARRPVILTGARFDTAATLRAFEQHRGTLLSVVPTMLRRLLHEPAPPSLRAVLLGGAATDPSLLAQARAQGWPVLPTYGMSETCAQACTQRLDDMAPDGVGSPMPGVSIRVRESQIEVSGPTLTLGYLGEPDLEEAWFRTGDLGRWDSHGHLHVLGRADARIITGGENVDPLEVEAALLTHPAVEEAVVFGRPDPEWGAAVVAVVVAQPFEPRAIREHLGRRLARFKHPKQIERVQTLPRLASGKVDRVAVERSMLPACQLPPRV